MGFIGNLFSGSAGMGFKPSSANIQNPVTTEQANEAYGNVQKGLGNQAAFLQALQGQGGIGNQSAVFNQQQQLANQLQGMTQGAGPNPALAQLASTTGQNVANTTAAMASARGASANPAAIARSAGMMGANAQQQAAGQAAALRAQQQLSAVGALQNQQQAMGNLAGTQVGQQAAATNAYTNAAQNAQQNILSGINAQNQANVGMTSNMNQVAGNIAGITAQGQQGLLGGLMGGAGSILGLKKFFASGGKVPSEETIERTNKPKIDEPAAKAESSYPSSQTGAGALQQGMSGLISGAHKFVSSPKAGEPGAMPGQHMRDYQNLPEFGNRMADYQAMPESPEINPVMIGADQTLPASNQLGLHAAEGGEVYLRPSILHHYAGIKMAEGGKVPAMVSPGEKYLTPQQAQGVLHGKVNPMEGKTIPGNAKVKGNSYANDTVPATLEEGGCVIPRSVMQSDRPMENAIKFVHDHMQKMAKGGIVKQKETEKEKMRGLDTTHQHSILQNPHFIFSATNPIVKPELNMSHQDLLKMLHDKGYPAEDAYGRYGNNDEPESVMIHNIKPNQLGPMMELAKKLGQESVIYSNGGKHEAHFVNGPYEGQYASGEGSQVHEEEPDDNYTKTKNGLIFSHNIDWSKLQPRG